MKTDEPKTVGERIKYLREEKKESQTALGKAIGLSQNAISKLEKGKTQLTLETQYNIAKHFHVSHDYICTGTDRNSILVLLEKYISLKYQSLYIGDEHLFYPLLCIDKRLFDYLVRTSRAKSDMYMPNEVRELWLKREIENFYTLNQDNHYDAKECVVPLPQHLIYPDDKKGDWKQSDLLREMNKLLLNPIAQNENKGE